LDGITLYAILREIERYLPMKVQKIHQPQTMVLTFSLWNRETRQELVLSLAQNRPFLGFSVEKWENPKMPPNFCLILRKRLEGGVLKEVRQAGLDRVAYLGFLGHDDFGNLEEFTLVFDAAGKGSNLGLFRKDSLVASAKPPDGCRFTAGKAYTPPAQENQLSLLEEVPLDRLVRTLLSRPGPLYKALSSSLSGVGKDLAWSLIHAAGLSPDNAWPSGQKAEALLGPLAEMGRRLRQASFTPAIYEDPGREPVFHVLPLYHLKVTETFGTCLSGFSAYRERALELDEFRSQKRQLEFLYKKVRGKLQSRFEAQTRDWEETGDAEKYRIFAELLNSSGKDVPAGNREMVVLDYYRDPPQEVTVPLDPRFSSKENAREYYGKYRKLKRARDILSESLSHLKDALDRLDEIGRAIDEAESSSDFEPVYRRLVRLSREYEVDVNLGCVPTGMKAAKGRARPRPKETGNSKEGRNSKEPANDGDQRNLVDRGKDPSAADVRKPFHTFTSQEGFQFFVGGSAQENDYLVRYIKRPGDIWLHAKNVQGAHVLIRPPAGGEITEEVLLQGAGIAARNSSARNSSKVEVDWVDAGKVTKPRGGPPGFVTYTGQKTILVKLDSDRKDSSPRLPR